MSRPPRGNPTATVRRSPGETKIRHGEHPARPRARLRHTPRRGHPVRHVPRLHHHRPRRPRHQRHRGPGPPRRVQRRRLPQRRQPPFHDPGLPRLRRLREGQAAGRRLHRHRAALHLRLHQRRRAQPHRRMAPGRREQRLHVRRPPRRRLRRARHERQRLRLRRPPGERPDARPGEPGHAQPGPLRLVDRRGAGPQRQLLLRPHAVLDGAREDQGVLQLRHGRLAQRRLLHQPHHLRGRRADEGVLGLPRPPARGEHRGRGTQRRLLLRAVRHPHVRLRDGRERPQDLRAGRQVGRHVRLGVRPLLPPGVRHAGQHQRHRARPRRRRHRVHPVAAGRRHRRRRGHL